MQPGLRSRRLMLAGATTALAAASTIAPALGKMPMGLAQAPYFYRFKHGSMEGTVISDGPIPLGDPGANFLGMSKEEMTKQLTDNFLSPTTMVLEQNTLVLNTGSHLILFDNGMGTEAAFDLCSKLVPEPVDVGLDDL